MQANPSGSNAMYIKQVQRLRGLEMSNFFFI